MNHKFKNSIFIILIALAISSCRPEKFKEIGDIPSKTKGLQDDWKLAHAYVVDEAFSTPDKLDITEFYATKTLPTITFTENTFTALTAGTVKNYFGFGCEKAVEYVDRVYSLWE